MAGDFNGDFNSDFSRLALAGQINATLTLSAALDGAHGVAGELAATLAVNAALPGEVAVEIGGDLAATLSLNAELRGRVARSRARAPRGGGRFKGRRVLFPVPLPAAPAKPYVAPVTGKLAARLSLTAHLTAYVGPLPLAAPPPPPIEASLLAGLSLAAGLVGEVLPYDETEDEAFILMLLAA